jgi:hypothetical protein
MSNNNLSYRYLCNDSIQNRIMDYQAERNLIASMSSTEIQSRKLHFAVADLRQCVTLLLELRSCIYFD